ncbi:CopD family protein [Halobellus rarus]|uniref:CopD family protein n=1 Tax=Halobellus rarus TaxID=1126237 RepID=A0ABD6CHD2_9EURY|nr:CopD family protein [Halobellus rarus]
MAGALHLLVRLAHVLGMAVLLGGAVAAWQALRIGNRDPRPVLRRYEWLFWGALGVSIATGVGNLGTLGPPGPTTRWGSILTFKLLVVAGVVVLSAVRSLAVGRLGDSGAVRSIARGRLRVLYAATGWALGAIVALAEVLAHG